VNRGYNLPLNPPPAPGFDVYMAFYQFKTNTVSEELRLASMGSGPCSGRWVDSFGTFALKTTPQYYFGAVGPLTVPDDGPYSYLNSNSSNSSAVFADTSYRLADRLTIGAGVRYFHDDQKANNGSIGSAAVVQQEATFHATTPRAYLRYQAMRDVNIYA